ncbi:MAG TPA: hypothetical protein VGF50_12905, partial [Caulobacteraceae bacterium]
MRGFFVIAVLFGLSACVGPFHRLAATHPAAVPAPVAAPTPKPAEGLWAALDPGCARPTAANIHLWPHCASPFWIGRGTATVLVSGAVDKRSVRDVSYRADYSLTPGDPL